MMSWIIPVLLGNVTTTISLAVTVVYCAYKLKGWQRILIATLIVIVMSEAAIALAIMKINIAQDPQSPIALYYYVIMVNPAAFILLTTLYLVIYGIEWLFFTRKAPIEKKIEPDREPTRGRFPVVLKKRSDVGSTPRADHSARGSEEAR